MFALWRIVILGLRCLALLIVLGLSGLLFYGLWAMHSQGFKLYGVQTGSMVPAIQVGDAVLVQPQTDSKLAVGQVVSYRNDNAVIISHRIRSINIKTRTVVTQGDNNAQPDSPVSVERIVGRVMVIMPKLGRVTDSLHKPFGLVAIIYIPATVAIIWQLRELQTWLRAPYRLRRSRELQL